MLLSVTVSCISSLPVSINDVHGLPVRVTGVKCLPVRFLLFTLGGSGGENKARYSVFPVFTCNVPTLHFGRVGR